MLEIYVDADACPVKDEVYKVAERYGLSVILVAAKTMRHPRKDWIRLVEVGEGFDAADDWIENAVAWGDIVVTTDIPLAARALAKGAWALSPKGKIFDEDSIGARLGVRDLMSHLRDQGMMTPGPAPFTVRDHSKFLERLDQVVHQVKKAEKRRARE